MDTFNVKRTTVTKEADKTTANGVYNITYTVTNGVLQSVSVRVYDTQEVSVPTADGQTMKQSRTIEVTTLQYEGGTVRYGTLPYSEKMLLYLQDFVDIVNEIVEPAQNNA